MDRFNALGRGAQLMLVAAVLLLIDLFLPWQDFVEGDVPGGLDTWSGWHGFVGVLLGLLTIVTLAWLVVRLMAVNIPLPVSTAMTGALLGVLVALFGIIKLLTILGEAQTIWAWIGVVLAILVAVGAYLQVQEAGGLDTLRAEATNLQSTTASPFEEAPPAATPPPAAPSETPPQAAEPAPAPPVEPAPAEPAAEPAWDDPDRPRDA